MKKDHPFSFIRRKTAYEKNRNGRLSYCTSHDGLENGFVGQRTYTSHDGLERGVNHHLLIVRQIGGLGIYLQLRRWVRTSGRRLREWLLPKRHTTSPRHTGGLENAFLYATLGVIRHMSGLEFPKLTFYFSFVTTPYGRFRNYDPSGLPAFARNTSSRRFRKPASVCGSYAYRYTP